MRTRNSVLTVDDVSIILSIVLPVIGLATAGIWWVVKRNSERMDEMQKAFSESVERLAQQYRSDTKILADEVHTRITSNHQEFSQFQVWVAKNHPERHEVDRRIDSAVQPMIREMQSMREQMASLNGNLQQFLQSNVGDHKQ